MQRWTGTSGPPSPEREMVASEKDGDSNMDCRVPERRRRVVGSSDCWAVVMMEGTAQMLLLPPLMSLESEKGVWVSMN